MLVEQAQQRCYWPLIALTGRNYEQTDYQTALSEKAAITDIQ
jgi:hypothetical protein